MGEHEHAPENASAVILADGPANPAIRASQLQVDTPSPSAETPNRSSSPSLSSRSGRTSSNTGSTSGSSGLPQISTPSSSVYITPDGLTPINPFASLSIAEDVDVSVPALSVESAIDEHRPLLTSESLRSYGGGSKRSGRTSTVSTPSIASSSEAKDLLGPLPVARPGIVDRPSSRIVQQHHQQQQQQHQQLQERYQRHLVQQQEQQLKLQQSPPALPSSPPPKPSPQLLPDTGAGLSPYSSPHQGSTSTFRSSPNTGIASSFRLPLPSPPAMGLSELLSGSPVTPSNETSYFSDVHSEPPPLSRANSGSRRTPVYSPFRSYYGPSLSDQPRRSELEQQRSLHRPTLTPLDSSSSSVQTVAAPRRSDRTPSESGSLASSGSNQSTRSPRVKNKGVLAPHGSFTSARSRTSSVDKLRKIAGAASDSALYVGNMRRQPVVDGIEEPAKDALRAAAMKGDQLAMYRLGWKADTPAGQKYRIGSIESVWGPTSP